METGTRTYSQTSDLNNFSRYADDAGDDDSAYHKYYDGTGHPDEHLPGGRVNVVGASHGHNRSSLMSMGGAMVDRAKGMLGMRDNNYSEMNLPLTENGTQRTRVDTAGTDDPPAPTEKQTVGVIGSVMGIVWIRRSRPIYVGPPYYPSEQRTS